MDRKKYRWCAVPGCKNTSIVTPKKIFIEVPRKEDIRKTWFELARRKCDGMSIKTSIFFCEDHFDLPNDMKNYMRYHIMGHVNRVMIKPGCLPSKFECQTDRKRSLPSTSFLPHPDAVKRQTLATIQEALEDSELKTTMFPLRNISLPLNKETEVLWEDPTTMEMRNTYLPLNKETEVIWEDPTTMEMRNAYLPLNKETEVIREDPTNMEMRSTYLPLYIETEVIREDPLPKTQNKCVQAFVKTKYFRSKGIQTSKKSKNVATSPSKLWTTTVSTSPFKVEEHETIVKPSVSSIKRKVMDRSDSDISEFSTSFQPSLPSVQSSQIKLSSDISSLNEEEVQLEKDREAMQALHNMSKTIEAKSRFYIGITNECYFLVDLIHTNTGIPTEHILLCLKKIRLNTTFSELADQFHISSSYAGKIFHKNIPMIASILKPFIVELNKECVKRTLPIAFRHRYNKVNSIIDCFEIEIEKPSKALHQALTWSEYKKGNTIKFLISSTPNGLVNYISPGYGGRITDTLLVEKCGFIEQLEPGSWVLADRGFKHIEQLLIQRKCHLLRPPTVVQGVKMTKQEARTTKQIASLRIHIERVIRRIREFSMLKPHSVLNSKLIRVLDDCVIIACALINLQDSIIK